MVKNLMMRIKSWLNDFFLMLSLSDTFPIIFIIVLLISLWFFDAHRFRYFDKKLRKEMQERVYQDQAVREKLKTERIGYDK